MHRYLKENVTLAPPPAAAATGANPATATGVADDPNAVADDPATATGVSEIVENSNAASDVASAAGTGEEASEWSDFQL